MRTDMPNDLKVKLARRLQRAVEKMEGGTQAELAAAVQTQAGEVCRWCSEKPGRWKRPTVAQYRRIAEETRLSLDYLLALTDEEDSSKAIGRPMRLHQAHEVLVNAVLHRVKWDGDVERLMDKGYHHLTVCDLAGDLPVRDALSMPKLVRTAKRLYMEAFDKNLRDCERPELDKLRREKESRHPIATKAYGGSLSKIEPEAFWLKVRAQREEKARAAGVKAKAKRPRRRKKPG